MRVLVVLLFVGCGGGLSVDAGHDAGHPCDFCTAAQKCVNDECVSAQTDVTIKYIYGGDRGLCVDTCATCVATTTDDGGASRWIDRYADAGCVIKTKSPSWTNPATLDIDCTGLCTECARGDTGIGCCGVHRPAWTESTACHWLPP